ncbi:MAG TPA: proline dehydrogenase family protein [Geothermobacteraceae bacterium]|nr:proline dehydrogenase family protein [Geothermobacteraceae bacterium]
MSNADLNQRIIVRGRDFFASLGEEPPSVFNKQQWLGKLLDWCMRQESFRLQLFRFVDVFPMLGDSHSLTRHLQEYFAAEGKEIPELLRWGAEATRWGGRIGGALVGKALRANIRGMAGQFIIGETVSAALKNLSRLREEGFAATIDVLGETTLSEEEAEAYVETYLQLISSLDESSWTPLADPEQTGRDWGHAPTINVSVKPSACSAQIKPRDFEGSVAAVCARLELIYAQVIEVGGFLCIDMESYRTKELTLEVYRRLRLKYPDYPHLGLALQAYLRDTDQDLERLLEWAERHALPISLRLVKGAYWDYETVLAAQNGWEVPVYTNKAATDAAFERQAKAILEHHPLCHLACASHNVRSIAAVLELAQQLGVPEERYEFQVLYGMAEPIRRQLLQTAGRVRLYAPYGELVPGMAYLVRRLLENTSNESFLRQSFAEQASIDQLLADPAEKLMTAPAPTAEPAARFRNEPAIDFSRAEQRDAFRAALETVRGRLGQTWPLSIDGRDVTTETTLPSTNPSHPAELIGSVCQAGTTELERAVAAARQSFPAWRDKPAGERAAVLRRAAELMRQRRFELAAWQTLEIAKPWDQAYADVAEAIDFLNYYAGEMERLAPPLPLGRVPGEENRYFYEPCGVAAVIAPWNFPLAISCGMVSAALVTGNCVIYKPSGLTPVIGRQLVEILLQAGIPPGVCNYLPGPGESIGAGLTGHPAVSLIAFTGSLETGRRIVESAARPQPEQRHFKRVIAEMGGKNAIIIDDDADLDEALSHVLYAAFGFSGQKCSACSRLIVLDAIYEQFCRRLVLGAAALRVGPAEDPAFDLGPVADAAQQKKILDYIEIGLEEGELLYQGNAPEGGHYVPVTIIGAITPEHRLAREEVFGPVLAVMRAKDFDQSLEWANASTFALTGGVFSRSPAHLERARREFRVGNLYLNRNCVGALVQRQPFGGAGLSGLGTKAGGPDYLCHFMNPRTVTENTLRRGFAPTAKMNKSNIEL